MKQPIDRPQEKTVRSNREVSRDVARPTHPRPPWETRQPAQVTKADVAEAKAHPGRVNPPGEMGESQGAAS